MQYISGMDAVAPPLPPTIWAARPSAGSALILALQAQVVALQTEVAALHAHRRELQARLGQDSSNSSRPPSASLVPNPTSCAERSMAAAQLARLERPAIGS